jgi:hypothetical protein
MKIVNSPAKSHLVNDYRHQIDRPPIGGNSLTIFTAMNANGDLYLIQ